VETKKLGLTTFTGDFLHSLEKSNVIPNKHLLSFRVLMITKYLRTIEILRVKYVIHPYK
jgi:hypothetical protein